MESVRNMGVEGVNGNRNGKMKIENVIENDKGGQK